MVEYAKIIAKCKISFKSAKVRRRLRWEKTYQIRVSIGRIY